MVLLKWLHVSISGIAVAHKLCLPAFQDFCAGVSELGAQHMIGVPRSGPDIIAGFFGITHHCLNAPTRYQAGGKGQAAAIKMGMLSAWLLLPIEALKAWAFSHCCRGCAFAEA